METECSPDNAAQNLDSENLMTTKALSLMRAKLPKYIVNCFEAAGYDTLDVIADMDVSKQPGNNIDEIENFITTTFPNNPNYYRDPSANGPLKFPPGHRKRICKFIDEIKTNNPVRKRPITEAVSCSTTTTKKSKPQNHAETPKLDQALVYGNIRRQIAKWQQSKNNIELKKLKEHEQFAVVVTVDGDVNVTASINCNMCGCKYTLGIKEGRCMISNWTRHVLKCVNTPKRRKRENNMLKYLTNTSIRSVLNDPNTAVLLPLPAPQKQSHTQKKMIPTTDLDCSQNETAHESTADNWQKENNEEITHTSSRPNSEVIDPNVVPHTSSCTSSRIPDLIVTPDPIVVEDVQPKFSVESGKETSDPFRLPPVASNLQ